MCRRRRRRNCGRSTHAVHFKHSVRPLRCKAARRAGNVCCATGDMRSSKRCLNYLLCDLCNAIRAQKRTRTDQPTSQPVACALLHPNRCRPATYTTYIIGRSTARTPNPSLWFLAERFLRSGGSQEQRGHNNKTQTRSSAHAGTIHRHRRRRRRQRPIRMHARKHTLTHPFAVRRENRFTDCNA